MKAIVTKYRSPTSTKVARIKASDSDGNTVTVPLEYGCSLAEAHLGAAYALCAKMNWLGYLAQGSVGNGFAHVFITDAANLRKGIQEIANLLTEDEARMSERGRTQTAEIKEARAIAKNLREGL